MSKSDASDTHLVPIQNQQKKPDKNVVKLAEKQLSRIIDPYSVRSHWSVQEIQTHPESVKFSNMNVMEKLEIPFETGSIEFGDKNGETYFLIGTNLEESTVEGMLCNLFGKRCVPLVVEKDNNGVIVKTKWKSVF